MFLRHRGRHPENNTILQQAQCARAAALSSHLSDAIFTQSLSFPANRLLSIPHRVCETRLVSQVVVALHVQSSPRIAHCVLHPLAYPMTIIGGETIPQAGNMAELIFKGGNEKPSRPVRSRRYTRRSFVAGQRPQKRLFTPEIKRYLKDWLVRRRENPYPNREEKKFLSRETGLTYIQICNWFANWRRKLKNASAERNQQTWGHLIRTYNDRAQGNVEQFSICSDDSIWSEPEPVSPEYEHLDVDMELTGSTETAIEQKDTQHTLTFKENCQNFNNNGYHVEQLEHNENSQEGNKGITSPMLLSKWLESAARFQPSESNYAWWSDEKRRKPDTKVQRIAMNRIVRHDRDEVEAAVALTALATATRLTAPNVGAWQTSTSAKSLQRLGCHLHTCQCKHGKRKFFTYNTFNGPYQNSV